MGIAVAVALLLIGQSVEKDKAVLKHLAGTWVETSVQYFGQELFDPPGTSNLMTFDGKKFAESMPSGKPLLRGEIKLVNAGKEHWDIDLPHNIFVQDKVTKTIAVKTIPVAAIVRPVGKDKLQIAYFDPDLIAPGKRPAAFESTMTNGVVLITLKRK